MKKLSTLCVTLISFIFSANVNASIVYTDVMPDINQVGNFTQDIDVDNNTVIDFRMTGAQSGNFSFNIMQANQVGVNNLILSDGAGNASALALNTVIGPSSTTWYQMNASNLLMITVANSVGTGTWAGATDMYLGLQFLIGTNTHFGWARFTFAQNTNDIIFKDYAYDNTPNTPILAGATLTAIADFSTTEKMIGNSYPNPASSVFTIELNNITEKTNFIISDILGNTVKQIEIAENTSAIKIDVTDIAAGIYSYSLSSTTQTESGKIEVVK